jgi:hypothetical protein
MICAGVVGLSRPRSNLNARLQGKSNGLSSKKNVQIRHTFRQNVQIRYTFRHHAGKLISKSMCKIFELFDGGDRYARRMSIIQTCASLRRWDLLFNLAYESEYQKIMLLIIKYTTYLIILLIDAGHAVKHTSFN